MAESRIVKGYHYTRSLDNILREGLTPKTNLVKDILPYDFRGFIYYAGIEEDWHSFLSLPDEAYLRVTKGLLEPKPEPWTDNSEYPGLWGKLMRAFFPCDYPSSDFPFPVRYWDEKLYVLEIELRENDSAFVIEEAYSRDIHDYKLPIDLQPGFLSTPTKENKRARANQIKEFCKRYYNSKVPLFQYSGNYRLPLLVISNEIPPERLKVHSVIIAKDIPEISHG